MPHTKKEERRTVSNRFLLLAILLSCPTQAMMYSEHRNTIQDEYYNADFNENEYTPIEITVILKRRSLLRNKTIKLSLTKGETVSSVLEHAVRLKYKKHSTSRLPQDFSILPYDTEFDIAYTSTFLHSVDDDMRYSIKHYKTTTFLLKKILNNE